ncbi:MAG: phosphoribosylformylglycinamidine synthase subunit PurS [Coriobacteriia bacterium]|nr:phosphoribosylformylglycinamidine synthase subunit PurS [Coriobacteriia bacterium]
MTDTASKTRYHIYVTSREGIFDPAGATALRGLGQIGFTGIDDVKIGKFIELEGDVSAEQVDEMCAKLLANPVIEDYRIVEVG